MLLVTGAAGYLGQALTSELDRSSVPYIGFDRKKCPNLNPRTFLVDLNDLNEVNKIIGSREITGLVHLAALKDVNESMRYPEKYRAENVEMFSRLLENLKGIGLRSIFYASSASVYGTQSGVISENSPTIPISVYGETKLTGEKLVQDFATSEGIQGTSLRIFNMASSTPGLGRPNLSTGVMQFISEAQISRSSFKIFGDSRKSLDGTAVRDYVSVNDVSKIIKLLTKQRKNDIPQVLNIGTGYGTSLKDLLRLFEIESGISVNFEIFPKSEFDIDISVASIDRLRLVIGDYLFEDMNQIVHNEIMSRSI